MSKVKSCLQTSDATVISCFIGYIVQAIVNNFLPLLFLTIQSEYDIPLQKITFLITFNFGFQMVIDIVSPSFVDKIGYRSSLIIAHATSALGLILLPILPEVMSSPYAGVMISVLIYAVGGGLLEVLVSPEMEACPTKNKETAMSMLHSFYCWGHVGVVLISTLFFTVFGIENWKILSFIWALIPLANMILFTQVPVYNLLAEGEKGLSIKDLAGNKVFWLLMVMMMCAGASEQSVSQWASTFAEAGLHVSKTMGDLFGPMFFAITMGISRAIYGKFGEKIDLKKYMTFSALLCVAAYLGTSLSHNPVLGLLGCGICGFSVGIMWPGTFSMGAAGIKGGGTMMFALFALAGDIGCSGGPTFVGIMSSVFNDDLKKGILFGTVFPILMLVGIRMNNRKQ